jgi:hypothetical protein
MPKQHSIISLEMPSEEECHTMSKPIFEPNTYDTTSDDKRHTTVCLPDQELLRFFSAILVTYSGSTIVSVKRMTTYSLALSVLCRSL